MNEELNTSTEAAKSGRPTQYRRAVKTFDVFEELFADAFVDHTPRPNTACGNSSDDYRQGRIGKSILEQMN